MEEKLNKKESDKINFVIDAKLKQQFNIKCIKNKTTMSKVLKAFIKEYVNEENFDLDNTEKHVLYDMYMD